MPMLPDFALTEEFLPTLLDLLPSGVVCYQPVTDAAGTVVDFRFAYLNPAAQYLLNLPAQPTTTFLQQFPGSRTNGAFAYHRDTFLAGTAAQFNLPDPARDFDSPLRLTAQRLHDSLLVTFAADSLLYRNLRAAKQNIEQLHRLTDALPILIGYLDQERRYCFANRAYEAWFNQPAEELLGHHVWEIVGEQAYEATFQYIDRALAGEAVEFTARMPYRPEFTKSVRASFIPDVQQGQVLGFYSLVTDMSEQAATQELVQFLNQELSSTNEELNIMNEELTTTNEQLKEANHHLKHVNTELDTFVYTASHDLQAPIANIEGLLTALQETLPAPDQLAPSIPRLLTMMHTSVARFQQTLGHLTDISRIHLVAEETTEEMNVATLVESVRLDLEPLLLTTKALFEVEISSGLVAQCAPKTLRSVVYNLLSNAVKYRAPDRTPLVQLRCYRMANLLHLEMQDNGLGLTTDQQGELFVLFRRLHTHVDGAGVGLYMVKRLVENAKGTIKVASQPGVGSTFTVSLPC